MAINRVAGLVLPGSTKYLIDDVIGKKQQQLLPLVLTVIAATLIQGLTSFALTQLLSKSAQRMITDLRKQVQAHIGRLSVSFYDANKTGALVSRIMSDVEGVRNLIGTGLVEFVGGLMTAVLALGVLLYINAVMTVVAFGVLIVFGLFLNKAFSTIRPIFRARPKINAEVTGRLTESLGGVRVVKGYHAEEHEEGVFASGAQKLLDNIPEDTDGYFDHESFGRDADGAGQRGGDVLERAENHCRPDDHWNVFFVFGFSGDANCAGVSDCGDWDAVDGSNYRTGAHPCGDFKYVGERRSGPAAQRAAGANYRARGI